MCGICGIYNYGDNKPVHRQQIRKMTNALVHRGPDQDGHYLSHDFGMGMRRLSIIDLETGHQPISNEDNSLHLICNGEIYNHKLLRKALIARGHIFKTASDVEVILHGFEEFGENCVDSLNGMFAFALWDERKRRLFIGRDRLGIKPLYYYQDERCFLFASELKALLQSGCVDRKLDPRAVDCLLNFEYVATPLTIVEKVSKLPAGHVLNFTEKNLTIKKYWDLRGVKANNNCDQKEIEQQLLTRLKRAVKSQLMSDVPLGAFLSGGLDSSLVVALMSEVSSRKIKTFSVGFEDAGYSELGHARKVAAHLNTEHYEFVVNPNDRELIREAILSLDEPLADASIVPTLLVSRAAREHVKVALSGDGGDELFAGYDSYRADQIASLYLTIPQLIRLRFFEPLLEAVPHSRKRLGFVNPIKGLLKGLQKPAWLGHVRWLTYLTPTEKKNLYHPEFLEVLNGYDEYGHIRTCMEDCAFDSRLARQLCVDLKSYLVDDVLTKVDRMSMAVSLEVRPPYLDHEVVEFVTGIPSSLKLTHLKSKYILKKSAVGLLPRSVIHRRKSGFSLPVKNWLRKELKPLVSRLSSDGFLNQYRPLFNEAGVRQLIGEHDSFRKDHSHILWTLIVLSTWCEENLSTP